MDGEPGTKWLTFAPTGWVEFDLDKPVRITTCALTSANDYAERDPRDWTLKGSTDGKDWKTVDTRSGETFAERFRTMSYDLAEPAEYQYFRLEVTRNNGAADILQLADVQLSTGGGGGPVPQDC
ncbi:discoidin domain-containing protein [Streptomyces tricolor]|nr:discoidin domain-containing protein [Streptomyces tricolor]